jgi:hypothetical protein
MEFRWRFASPKEKFERGLVGGWVVVIQFTRFYVQRFRFVITLIKLARVRLLVEPTIVRLYCGTGPSRSARFISSSTWSKLNGTDQ